MPVRDCPAPVAGGQRGGRRERKERRARGWVVGGGGYRRPRCGVGERGRWGARGERTQRHCRRPAGSRRTAVLRRRRSGCVRLEVGSGRGARPSVCPSVQAASSHHSTAGVRPGSLREVDALPRWDSLPLPPTFSPLLLFFILFFFPLFIFYCCCYLFFFFPGSVTLAPGPKEFFFKQTMDKRKVAAPGEFPRHRRGAAGCAAQLAPHLPTFRLCFRLGKSRACPPSPEKGHFPSAAARPSAGSRLGEYRRNLSAVTLFPCRCAPRFLLLPWRRGCVYTEDGFRENVFASPSPQPPPPFIFFSLVLYGTGEAQTS